MKRDLEPKEITAESKAIAAVVDGFPVDLRIRLRDALFRIADVYRANGVPEHPMVRQKRSRRIAQNVICLAARRAR